MKHIEMKPTNFLMSIFLLLIFISLISCGNNQICIDKESQVLYSKDRNVLRKIIIKEQEGEMVFVRKKEEKEGSFFLNLKVIDTTNFTYLNSLLNREVDFFLKPNSIYEISNQTIGDAAAGNLIIKTDEEGKIFYSNSVCK